MSIQKVALAGGTGEIGEPVLKALVDAGFEVTLFTRPESNKTPPSSVKVVKVDYSDTTALTSALEGQDALVSTVGNAGFTSQHNFLDAAIAAGVKRFLPSEFGCDLQNERVKKLPVFGLKINLEEEIAEKTKGTDTTYTLVYTNAFLDWGLQKGLLIDIVNKKALILDSGDERFTANNLDDIAKGVVAVLKKPEETKNRSVRLNTAVVTQNQLLKYAQKHSGSESWDVSHAKSEDLEKDAHKAFENKEPPMTWAIGFIKRAIVGEGFGGDFSGNNDNDVLELKQQSDEEIEQLVKELLEKKPTLESGLATSVDSLRAS